MKPEEKSEIILWDWIKTKGQCVRGIYFNRKNKLGENVFTISGDITEKPDWILCIDRGYGKEYAAIEIKCADKRKDVLDSNKIFRYHRNYVEGKTQYFIDDKKIEIKYFLIATEYSKDGHLFRLKSEGNIIDNIKDSEHEEWKKCLAQWGFEPEFEYFGTAQFQRHLFAQFREYRREIKNQKSPGIGILISEINDKSGVCSGFPHIFIMNFNDYNKEMKAKWGCRYWKI